MGTTVHHLKWKKIPPSFGDMYQKTMTQIIEWMHDIDADLVMPCEHHRRGQGLEQVRAQLAPLVWKMLASLATLKTTGLSGGEALLFNNYLAVQAAALPRCCSPRRNLEVPGWSILRGS